MYSLLPFCLPLIMSAFFKTLSLSLSLSLSRCFSLILSPKPFFLLFSSFSLDVFFCLFLFRPLFLYLLSLTFPLSRCPTLSVCNLFASLPSSHSLCLEFFSLSLHLSVLFVCLFFVFLFFFLLIFLFVFFFPLNSLSY